MLTALVLTTALAMTQPPCGSHAMAPAVCATTQGVWVTWLEPVSKAEPTKASEIWRLRISRFDGVSWTSPHTITQRQDFFINWADTPQIAAAPDGALIATWLQKNGSGTYAYDIGVARSDDAGKSWTMLGTLNDDRTQTEHGFVSMAPEAEGVRAIWLDGRAMMSGEHGEHGHAGGDMSLRTTMITDTIQPSTLLDNRTCECCPTTMTESSAGTLIAYRDRLPSERRDISVVRLTDNGWTSPKDLWTDGWEINGCPVNGPASASNGLRTAVVWYTGAENPGVRAAISEDGGITFDEPITLAGEEAVGRVAVAWPSDNNPVAIWIDEDDSSLGNATLALASLGDAEVTAKHIATLEAGRGSGYPRIAALPDGRCLVIWTSKAREEGLRAHLIDISED